MIKTTKSRRLAMSLTAAALAGGTLVGTTGPAHAACPPEVRYTTPYAGGNVWIPTTDYSDWATGGRITRTISDGSSTTRTVGSSHSVTATGKVGAKVGPVGAEVTTTYNYKHNKSTTTRTSVTRTWSYSFGAVAGKTYRVRAYKLGRVFKYKRYVLQPTCSEKVTTLYAFAPTKSGAINWMREYYANRGAYRYDNLR